MGASAYLIHVNFINILYDAWESQHLYKEKPVGYTPEHKGNEADTWKMPKNDHKKLGT